MHMYAGILVKMAKLHNLGLYEFILHGSQFRQIGMGGGGGGGGGLTCTACRCALKGSRDPLVKGHTLNFYVRQALSIGFVAQSVFRWLVAD